MTSFFYPPISTEITHTCRKFIALLLVSIILLLYITNNVSATVSDNFNDCDLSDWDAAYLSFVADTPSVWDSTCFASANAANAKVRKNSSSTYDYYSAVLYHSYTVGGYSLRYYFKSDSVWGSGNTLGIESHVASYWTVNSTHSKVQVGGNGIATATITTFPAQPVKIEIVDNTALMQYSVTVKDANSSTLGSGIVPYSIAPTQNSIMLFASNGGGLTQFEDIYAGVYGGSPPPTTYSIYLDAVGYPLNSPAYMYTTCPSNQCYIWFHNTTYDTRVNETYGTTTNPQNFYLNNLSFFVNGSIGDMNVTIYSYVNSTLEWRDDFEFTISDQFIYIPPYVPIANVTNMSNISLITSNYTNYSYYVNASSLGMQGYMTNITSSVSNISGQLDNYNYTTHKSILSLVLPAWNLIPAKLWLIGVLNWIFIIILIILNR